MRKAIFLFTLFCATLSAANFSGEWKLNPAKSDFGPAPAPEMMTRSIKQTLPAVEISTHQKGAAGESTTELKYTLDGKESVNKLPTGESKGTAKLDGDRMVIESTREFQGMSITGKETWSLSEGGKVLTILNHISVPAQGEIELKLVFDKQ
jgi:hypothetical protein